MLLEGLFNFEESIVYIVINKNTLQFVRLSLVVKFL